MLAIQQHVLLIGHIVVEFVIAIIAIQMPPLVLHQLQLVTLPSLLPPQMAHLLQAALPVIPVQLHATILLRHNVEME